MQIDYFERDGKLWFLFQEKIYNKRRGYRIFESSGVVPPDLKQEETEGIRRYVEQKVEEDIAEQKRRAAEHD